MSEIWLTSDLHFFHDRGFIYEPRGFKSVREMNDAIIENYNRVVKPDDDVYILGDLLLGGPDSLDKGLKLIGELNGNLHLVRGNHDTDTRWFAYSTLQNVVEQQNAIYLKHEGYHFFMTHYPCFTANLEKESLKQCTINLYGHTHQMTHFYQDIPFMYNVGVDSHDCAPVSIDQAILDMKAKVRECLNKI